MPKFSKIIFDLDGVVYRGHTPIPGVASAIVRLKKAGIAVAYLTNNATRSRHELRARLGSMGISTSMDDIMTSAFAAACYLKKMKPKPQRVFVLGERGLRNEIRSAGFRVLPPVLKGEKSAATTFTKLSGGERAPKADVLVTGLDRQVTYAKFASALDVLNFGAPWVACNLDPTLPMEHGAHPGSGSLNALLAYATGKVNHEKHAKAHAISSGRPFASLSQIQLREPDFVAGKPNSFTLQLLAGQKKSERSAVLFVGDRLDIDIQFANSAGLSSCLVLTGMTKEKEARAAKGLLKPNYILPSAAQLPNWLKC